jgi:signal transduction histidine kinase
MSAQQNVQALLQELIDAARKGSIIPVRLAGQLEEIAALLQQQDTPVPEPAAAQEASSDRGEIMREQAYFISHAVHELRTPMTSIRGYADMLVNPAMGTLTDMQKQFMDTIRANARRMDTLMTDVSDIAKIRGGTLKISLKMDMFKNIAMMVENAMKPVAESLGRSLTFDIPQGLPLLNTDGELLAKALNKLVENGLRYQEREDGSVTVRGRADGGTLVIEIADTGIGMTADDLAQLGMVYYRSEHEIVRSHKGSGLGIPVAYGIIRALGGSVEVRSEEGAGTTFTVRIAGMS